MTHEETEDLIRYIRDVSQWMQDAACCVEGATIEDLAKDYGDTLDVVVDIHLTNGRTVRIKNYCYDSVTLGRYVGDTMNLYETYVDVCMNENDNYHQIHIPLSSICYIDSFGSPVNWKGYLKQ